MDPLIKMIVTINLQIVDFLLTRFKKQPIDRQFRKK